VADVCWRVILQELEVGGEITGQEALPDKDQHCTAYSEQGFLCSADKVYSKEPEPKIFAE